MGTLSGRRQTLREQVVGMTTKPIENMKSTDRMIYREVIQAYLRKGLGLTAA